jgi:hypothetical protein
MQIQQLQAAAAGGIGFGAMAVRVLALVCSNSLFAKFQ